MDLYHILLGTLSIVFGILIIDYFQKLIIKEKQKLFYLNFQTAGVIFIIMGIALIVRGCK